MLDLYAVDNLSQCRRLADMARRADPTSATLVGKPAGAVDRFGG
jgi:hypothetical protein